MSEGLDPDPRAANGSSRATAETTDGANNAKPEKRGHWWTNPAIAVPAVLAVIGIVITTFFALYPRSPKPVDNLADCQRAHPGALGLAAASSTAPLGTTTTIEGCVWPPVTGTDSSGFWTAGVTDYPIAGSSAASQYDYVAVFTTSCQALSLDYQFNDQLTVAHKRFTVETSQTVSGYDGTPVNLLAGGSVPDAVTQAEGTHLIVLYNSRYILQHFDCAAIS